MKINLIFLCAFIFSFNSINSHSIKNILSKKNFPKVVNGYLDLSNQNITDLRFIEDYPEIQNVEQLILNDNKIKSLEPLRKLSLLNLKIIDISNNKIADLSPLKIFKKLEKIYVEYNEVTANNLCNIFCLPNLVELYIDHNPIDDAIFRYYYERNLNNRFDYLEIFENGNEIINEVLKNSAKKVFFKKIKNLETEDEKCSICYDNDNNDEYSLLNCNHHFHANCLRKWFETGNRTCPICRRNL